MGDEPERVVEEEEAAGVVPSERAGNDVVVPDGAESPEACCAPADDAPAVPPFEAES